MNFKKLATDMVPFVRRNDLLEDLDATAKIIKDNGLPLYERAKFLDSHKWSSKEMRTFQAEWDKKSGLRGNWVPQVRKVLENCLKNAEVLRRLISRYMADETYREAMSYLKANLASHAVYMGFFSRYATMVLNHACACEARAAGSSDVKELTPADQRWLTDNAETFCELVPVLNRKDSKLKAELEKVPNTVIEADQVSYQVEMLGKNAVDPTRAGFIATKSNPILWVQLKIADWVHDRYEAAQQERTTVELRLSNLEAQLSNKPEDENIRGQIAYQQDRLSKLNRSIADYEEKIGEL